MVAGNIGLAPAIGVTATSAVPMRTGGNFDQRRLGKGATLYLPVEVGGEAAQHSWCLLLWRCCCRCRLAAAAAERYRSCGQGQPQAPMLP